MTNGLETVTTGQQPNYEEQHNVLTVAKGGGIVFAGWIVGIVITYIYSLILARTIGAENFGLFTLGLSIIGIPSVLASLGLGQGIVRFGAIYAQNDDKAKLNDVVVKSFGLTLAASIVVSIGLLALATWPPINVFENPYLAYVLAALTITIPFTALRRIFLAGTQAFKITWMLVLVEKIVLPIGILIISVILIALQFGLQGVLVAFIVSSIVAAFYAFYLLRQLLPNLFKKREQGVPLAKLLKFSLPLSLVSLLHFSYERTETIFLGFMSSATNVGIYSIALRIAALETMFLQSVNVIFAPFIADLFERKEMADLESLYKTIAQWSFTTGLALFMLFMLFSEPILSIFGAEFRLGATALVILGIGQLVNAGVGPAGYMLVMTGRSDLVLINTIVLLVSSVILDMTLIPKYDLTGAAIAGSLAILILNVLRVAQVNHFLKMHPFKITFWKPVAAGMGAMLATYALQLVFPVENDLVEFFILSPIFCLIFILLIYKLGLENEDRLVLLAIQKKMNEFLPFSIKVI